MYSLLLSFDSKYKNQFIFLGVLLVLLGIASLNFSSLINFIYYFILWLFLLIVIDSTNITNHVYAFTVNSLIIVIYYIFQLYFYPDTLGTTSPLASWTDDSYFFALVADSIPSSLDIRENYSEYTHPFTSLIRLISFFPINHPMDVIFFQSGVAAFLASSSRKLALQLSDNQKISISTFYFILFCPFIAMHGGVIFLRDTFVSALFVYSLCCINDRKYLLAFISVILSLIIRPGTILILIFAYSVLYWREMGDALTTYRGKLLVFTAIALIFSFSFVLLNNSSLLEHILLLMSANEINFFGREMYEDIYKKGDSFFVSIQNLPFVIKLVLGGLYFYLYPFFSFKEIFALAAFDLRMFLMSVFMPIYSIFLNTFFIAGFLGGKSNFKKISLLAVSVLLVYVLLGTYSLQTRHKTIVQPLFYIVIAFGLFKSNMRSKFIGFVLSIAFFVFQLTYAFIK